MSLKGMNVSFLIPITCLVIVVIWVGIQVVGKNIAAKDLVFSYTALVAAMVMFLLNIFLSLQGHEETKVIQPHVTHNGTTLDTFTITGKKSTFIVVNREEISHFLSIPNSQLDPIFRNGSFEETDTAISEFLRVAIIGSLLSDYPDWEAKETRFRGSIQTSLNYKKSNAGKNSFITTDELITQLKLKVTKEVLAKTSLAEGLTLPPKTKLLGDTGRIIFDTPYVCIEICIEVRSGYQRGLIQYLADGSRFSDMMSNTYSHLLNYDANIYLSMTFKKQRAGSLARPKYVAWSNNLYKFLNDNMSPT